jgi:hypothetical protein
MTNPTRKIPSKIEQPIIDEWQARSSVERRSDIENRTSHDQSYLKIGGIERRKIEERRHPAERRDGWLLVGLWRSESVFDLNS